MGGALPRREQPPEPEQITCENWRHDLLQVPFCPLLGPVSGFFLGLLRRLGCPARALLKPETGTAPHFHKASGLPEVEAECAKRKQFN